MKNLYELLTYPLSVIEDPFWDWVLLAIIGSVSFAVAWNFVGETGIRGRAGSILHWTIRLIVTFLLSIITSLFIKLIVFIYNMPLYAWLVIIIGIVLLILLYVVLKFTILSKRSKEKHSLQKFKNKYIFIMKKIINNYYANKTNILKREDIIRNDDADENYIYNELETMLIKEKLMNKDEEGNNIIDFRAIAFLEKHVNDSSSYILNILVFIITFASLMISGFGAFFQKGFLSFVLFAVILIFIFKYLPKDK